jgi:hypothetical protein
LALQDNVATKGILSEESDGFDGFISRVDATGNGAFGAPAPFVYVKFTPTGMEKVAIDDEASFGNMEWDLAFRRYVIRTNSGVGGPSCARAARLPANPSFESVTGPPTDDSLYRTEEYTTGTCELIPDGSGLPDAPSTAMAKFWEYPAGCVKMTDQVFVIELKDGHHVKFQVLAYYDPQVVQDSCDAGDGVGGQYTSAIMRTHWAYLD